MSTQTNDPTTEEVYSALEAERFPRRGRERGRVLARCRGGNDQRYR